PGLPATFSRFWEIFGSKEDVNENGWTSEYRRLHFSRVVLPHHSGGKLVDRPCGNPVRPEWTLSGARRARGHGAFRCTDDRARSCFAGSRAAQAWRRVRHRRDHCRGGDLGRARATVTGGGLGGRLPAV